MAYKSRKSAALSTAEVRAFANANGLKVGARGRFSADVIAKFLASQPKTLLAVAAEVGVSAPKSLKAGSKRVETLAAEVAPLAR